MTWRHWKRTRVVREKWQMTRRALVSKVQYQAHGCFPWRQVYLAGGLVWQCPWFLCGREDLVLLGISMWVDGQGCRDPQAAQHWRYRPQKWCGCACRRKLLLHACCASTLSLSHCFVVPALLEFNVIPLALHSADLVSLSSLGSVLHVVLIPQEDHGLLDLIHGGAFQLPSEVLSLHIHLCDHIQGWCWMGGLGDLCVQKFLEQHKHTRDPGGIILSLESHKKICNNGMHSILLLEGLREMELDWTNNSVIHLGLLNEVVLFFLVESSCDGWFRELDDPSTSSCL